MRHLHQTWLASTPTLLGLAIGLSGPAGAQAPCVETPEGRICQVQQPIIVGDPVGLDLQRQLGLVTVDGRCSGALMNRYWVLTARHCVTTGGVGGALLPPGQVEITAAWAPGETATATRLHDFAVNRAPGAAPARDIVLVYLGAGDLGPVNRQIPYITQRQVTTVARWNGARLAATDVVNQYGRGLSTFATGVVGGTPPAVQGGGGGTYRTARFNPSNVTETHYDLAMNANSQVGAAGDSGGPTVIGVPDGRVYIAGVQTTCQATGYVPGAPSTTWPWATGISRCTYVSVEPLVQEIGRAVSETPLCRTRAACTAPVIAAYGVQ